MKMKNYRLVFYFFSFCLVNNSLSQEIMPPDSLQYRLKNQTISPYYYNDTVVVYDVASKTVSFISPPIGDTIATFGNTGWQRNIIGNTCVLDLNPPSYTAPNSGFTDLTRASSLFDLNDYPASAAVKLFYYINDTLRQLCSGMLISQNVVLTAAHCLYSYYQPRKWYDSVLVKPAFDNGIENNFIGESLAKKYYIFKEWYSTYTWIDIALIELQQPLGKKAGWISLGYNENDSVFYNRNFHCFSYPGQTMPLPWDTSKHYNGDTMYYHYGILNCIGNNAVGSQTFLIPGCSGSSIFTTNNNSTYISYGVANRSGCGSQFYRVQKNNFTAFKFIMETQVDSVWPVWPVVNKLISYPNPATDKIYFDIAATGPQNVDVYLNDLFGREILSQKVNFERGNYTFSLDVSTLSAGIYILKTINVYNSSTSKIIKL